MYIQSSTIAFVNRHESQQINEREESLVAGKVTAGQRWSEENLQQGVVFHSQQNSTKTELSVAGQSIPAANLSALIQKPPVLANPGISGIADTGDVSTVDEISAEAMLEPELLVLKLMLEKLTGHKIELLELTSATKELSTSSETGTDQNVDPPTPEWGLEYHFREYFEESEVSYFAASGEVVTGDGKRIEMDVELSMSRHFVSENRVDVVAGAARMKDPLVINLNGSAATLTDARFHFDIDADGIKDELARLHEHSGFLVLDRNADGKINDGTELFGAISGDGFSDLAEFDDDGNGWIDENDAVFSRLEIWFQGEQGDRLVALGEIGLGAIYLTNQSTPFELKDSENRLLGQVRSSGIYLNEDYSVGTVQQIDLAV